MALRLWESVLWDMEALPASSDETKSFEELPRIDGGDALLRACGAHNKSIQQLQRVKANTTVPAATLDKLVHRMKVPQKLATVCSTLSGQLGPALHHALSTLHLLLLTARGSEVFDASSDSSSSESGAASTVAAAIKQQVQASGLLEHLPGLLTAVADSLRDLPSALPWMNEDDSTLQRTQLRHSCAGLTASQNTQLLQDTRTAGLLEMFVPLLGTWATLAYAAPSLLRPSVPNTLRLSSFGLQHGSDCILTRAIEALHAWPCGRPAKALLQAAGRLHAQQEEPVETAAQHTS